MHLLRAFRGNPYFPVTRSPQRKDKDKERLFSCPFSGGTCWHEASWHLEAQPGLALPTACLELDLSGLGKPAQEDTKDIRF